MQRNIFTVRPLSRSGGSLPTSRWVEYWWARWSDQTTALRDSPYAIKNQHKACKIPTTWGAFCTMGRSYLGRLPWTERIYYGIWELPDWSSSTSRWTRSDCTKWWQGGLWPGKIEDVPSLWVTDTDWFSESDNYRCWGDDWTLASNYRGYNEGRKWPGWLGREKS